VADIRALYNLQKVDVALLKARRRLLQLQKLLEENDQLQAAQKKVAETEAQLHEWEAKQKDNELESQALDSRIASTDEQLMSGKVTNPKELESLQASLEALRRQRAGVDDDSVESMLRIEQLKEQLSESRSELDQVKSDWQSKQSALVQEGKKLQKQYKVLKQNREALTQAMDDALLERYEQLRKRKNGVAVAQLEGDSCGACHMQVPSGVISSVHSATSQLDYCPSCGRILVDD